MSSLKLLCGTRGAWYCQRPRSDKERQGPHLRNSRGRRPPDDPALRVEFERTLVAKAREHNYDAVTSDDLAPTVTEVDSREFVETTSANKIDLVLLIRPAAIGPDSSLDSV